MPELSPPSSPNRFLLTSANLLIETNTYNDRNLVVPQQYERLTAHIDAFRTIRQNIGARSVVEVIGLQELQVTRQHHNGKVIQEALGYQFGLCRPQSRVEHGENIGVVSNTVPDSYEVIELEKDHRYAPVLRFGDTSVVVVHPMFSNRHRRRSQYEVLFEFLGGEKQVAVIGDFNEDPLQRGLRNKFGRLGLHSAFVRDYKGHPVTLPAAGYGQYRSLPRRIGFEMLGGGMRYDDVYVSEGIQVNRTGTVDSESDHRFVWADLSTAA